MKTDRRDFIKKSSSLAATFSVAGLRAYAAPGETDAKKIEWPDEINPQKKSSPVSKLF